MENTTCALVTNTYIYIFIAFVGRRIYGPPDGKGLPSLMDISNGRSREPSHCLPYSVLKRVPNYFIGNIIYKNKCIFYYRSHESGRL